MKIEYIKWESRFYQGVWIIPHELKSIWNSVYIFVFVLEKFSDITVTEISVDIDIRVYFVCCLTKKELEGLH